MSTLPVNLVTRGDPGKPWRMVLVEEGPWNDAELESKLRGLQERLYDSVDAAIEGVLAQHYPGSRGQSVVIRVDGYNLPEGGVRSLVERFAATMQILPEYVAAIAASDAVKEIGFEVNLERLPARDAA